MRNETKKLREAGEAGNGAFCPKLDRFGTRGTRADGVNTLSGGFPESLGGTLRYA